MTRLRALTFVGALIASAFAAMPALAQLATDMKLEDAGFKMREANTPQKMARLTSIPARKFVPHRKNGQLYYVYADPQCRCAFVGSPAAMQNYRDMVAPPRSTGLPGVNDFSRNPGSGGGINLENELQNEMDNDGGGDFDDDIFHPGF